jgi:hypothetical protein
VSGFGEFGGTTATGWPGPADRSSPRAVLDALEPGSTTGIGSLPQRSARQAVEFSFDMYDIPTIPSLPRRSPAESSIAQALVGVFGVAPGQYGSVAVDVDRLDPDATVDTDLRTDHFVGFRTFLEVAAERGHTGPVKWQFVGPISVGVTLRRAGAGPEVAFSTALRAISSHLRALSAAVSAALPSSPQLVVLDEPFTAGLMSNDFPIAPDEAIDLLSAAMSVLESQATVGVHCCGEVDVATMLESGPSVLSLPVSNTLVPLAGYLDRFLRNDGWIAWGAIATEGPIGVTSNRAWHHLSSLWCELVRRGCDPERLRTQSLLTPECGLGTHSPVVAERVCRSLRDVSRSLRSEAAAAKLVLGA